MSEISFDRLYWQPIILVHVSRSCNAFLRPHSDLPIFNAVIAIEFRVGVSPSFFSVTCFILFTIGSSEILPIVPYCSKEVLIPVEIGIVQGILLVNIFE